MVVSDLYTQTRWTSRPFEVSLTRSQLSSPLSVIQDDLILLFDLFASFSLVPALHKSSHPVETTPAQYV